MYNRMTRFLINDNPMLYNIAKIMSSSLAPEIDKLTNVGRVGYLAWIAEELDHDLQRMINIVRQLRKAGISFTTNIKTYKIGLIEYTVLVMGTNIRYDELPKKIKSWVKFYAETFTPHGCIVTYCIPYAFKDELHYIIRKELEKIVNSSISMVTLWIRRQPSFSKYEFEKHPLYKGYRLMELEKLFQEAEETKPREFIDRYELERSISEPNDIIDLIVLKELEKNGLVTAKEISQTYGIESARIRKHLINHIVNAGLINGIYIKTGVFVKAFGSPLLLMLRIRSRGMYYKLINFFKALENVATIGYTPFIGRKSVLYVTVLNTLKGNEAFKNFLFNMMREGFIEEVIPIDYILSTVKKFTIPYLAFYQDERRWDLDAEKTHKLFKRRILRERE